MHFVDQSPVFVWINFPDLTAIGRSKNQACTLRGHNAIARARCARHFVALWARTGGLTLSGMTAQSIDMHTCVRACACGLNTRGCCLHPRSFSRLQCKCRVIKSTFITVNVCAVQPVVCMGLQFENPAVSQQNELGLAFARGPPPALCTMKT